jgi:hypothetical protein
VIIIIIIIIIMSWGIIIGIATRYGLDGSGIESQWGRDFPHPSRPVLLYRLLYNGYRDSFQGVIRSGRGVDHARHLAPRLKKE